MHRAEMLHLGAPTPGKPVLRFDLVAGGVRASSIFILWLLRSGFLLQIN